MNSDAEIPSVMPGAHRSERGFWALIAAQFQGAYSDSILRNMLFAMRKLD
jgi:hypothetical protein